MVRSAAVARLGGATVARRARNGSSYGLRNELELRVPFERFRLSELPRAPLEPMRLPQQKISLPIEPMTAAQA
jgi:hypothetical protein